MKKKQRTIFRFTEDKNVYPIVYHVVKVYSDGGGFRVGTCDRLLVLQCGGRQNATRHVTQNQVRCVAHNDCADRRRNSNDRTHVLKQLVKLNVDRKASQYQRSEKDPMKKFTHSFCNKLLFKTVIISNYLLSFKFDVIKT